ncbi:MAG TPA: YibE/F family protein [Ruminiclostridium sp.]|uniref:YibE/F-like protein n=3 Tax=Acetivibrio saccincola TaxID=1677857 RepID=A0A2K9ELE0_9FIRM|nr:YibE/F family protein [Acetivibrio saccincola]AUG57401.1 YibE/F-like protein [Acetivibrio saccincola]NLW26595.1 YibE/F family protein [Acetivibrio saccincola]HAA42860.1 YibE/F family protein [Ruminiclostridium sp.]
MNFVRIRGFTFVFLMVLCFVFFFLNSAVFAEEVGEIMQEEDKLPKQVRAVVLNAYQVENEEKEYSGGILEIKTQMLEVKILKGPHKGKIIKAQNSLNSFNDAYNITISRGQEVFVYINEAEDGSIESAYVAEIVRDKYILYLLMAFILSMLVVGRMKGFKALISLAITCIAVIYIMLPLLLKGYNPIIVSVPVCVGVIVITLLLVSGFNKKSFAAIIGTAGGVIIAGVIALLMGYFTNMTGLGSEEAQMLQFTPLDIKFNFKGLLFAGILIGAMGAIMDVGISIASSLTEIAAAKEDISTKDLIKSGMNVGRDILGSMSNTLILAYTSASIPLLLLAMAYKVSFIEMVNWEVVASEIVRALSSSIGLVITVPLTAVAAATLLNKKNAEFDED